MRSLFLSIAILFPAVVVAQEKKEPLVIKWELDSIGKMPDCNLLVAEVLGNEEILVRGVASALGSNKQEVTLRITPDFVLKTPTKGIVDGKKLKPSGLYKVVGTKKVNGKTIFVVEPYTPKP